MARDVAILEAVSEGQSPPTLRLYGWDPPCLTLGRHQGVEAADFDFCSAEGIDVVRRPTGGRALLHHLELTYAVVAPTVRGGDRCRAVCRTPTGGSAARWCVRCDPRRRGRAHLGEVNLQLPGPRIDSTVLRGASGWRSRGAAAASSSGPRCAPTPADPATRRHRPRLGRSTTGRFHGACR